MDLAKLAFDTAAEIHGTKSMPEPWKVVQGAMEIAEGTPEGSDPDKLDQALTDIANHLRNALESYRAGDYDKGDK